MGNLQLKQFHAAHTDTFLAYIGQYVRTTVNNTALAATKSAPFFTPEVTNILLFLEEFCKYTHVPRKRLDAIIPPFLFGQFKHGQ